MNYITSPDGRITVKQCESAPNAIIVYLDGNVRAAYLSEKVPEPIPNETCHCSTASVCWVKTYFESMAE